MTYKLVVFEHYQALLGEVDGAIPDLRAQLTNEFNTDCNLQSAEATLSFANVSKT